MKGRKQMGTAQDSVEVKVYLNGRRRVHKYNREVIKVGKGVKMYATPLPMTSSDLKTGSVYFHQKRKKYYWCGYSKSLYPVKWV